MYARRTIKYIAICVFEFLFFNVTAVAFQGLTLVGWGRKLFGDKGWM